MPSTPEAPRRNIVYCIVPADLAVKLHEPLRRHFADDPEVEVVVEHRWRDRRRGADRRTSVQPVGDERRRIRAGDGRRAGERRAVAVPVDLPVLPRRVAHHAPVLRFVERVEPSAEALEDQDTARLVMRIQAGQRDAFGDLYLRYFDRVYAYLLVVLNDPVETEEVTQQVFVKVLEALGGYERRPGLPFRAWMFIIARNQAITELRRRNRSEPWDPTALGQSRDEPVGDAGGEVGALSWLTDRELLMFVERLPVAQRQVLVLRYMLDLTAAQIAEILDFTPNQVRMLQHRAQAFLRERLTALGRKPEHDGRRLRNRVRVRQAIVLRERRFVLS